ncbi:MBL fold metallo-hydrolase [Clostridiales bacterium]|nr:MBL fold metallo-hydrolase [Clostridiales bacterium]
MELKRLNEHIWFMPYEEGRDRPNLCYVKGGRMSLAVDAGHSAAHVREFYALLEKENLPLPDLTVLTHWHWDHTFGMHAVHGLTLANERTNRYLAEWKEKIEKNGPGEFLAIHESIRREYPAGTEVTVRTADIVFDGELTLDLGGCTVKVVQAEAPHTDDSTLVYVENDRVLFVGDSTCHDFFTGIKRADLCAKMADTIRKINPAVIMEGHWIPVPMEDTLEDLMTNLSE